MSNDPFHIAKLIHENHAQVVRALETSDIVRRRRSQQHWLCGPHKVYEPFEGEVEPIELNISTSEDAMWEYLDERREDPFPQVQEIVKEAIEKFPWGKGVWTPGQWQEAKRRVIQMIRLTEKAL